MNIDIRQTDAERYINLLNSEFQGKEMYAYVLTFGCQQNEADSEKIRGMARRMGYLIAESPQDADMIVINTCAIRKHAEMKALSALGNFKVLKKEKPELVIGIVGCMAAEPQVADMIKKTFHYVSFTLEPSMISKFPELVWKSVYERKRSFVFGSDENNIVEGIEPVRESGHRAWVSIMYGCNNFCSYCIVPYVRGRERSRDSANIIAECKDLVKSGYREIILLGQNVNSYKSNMDFAELLENIAMIPGDFVIRFMTSHPKDVSDGLIDVMSRHTGKIAPCFHLPLQSGSDAILKVMNRTYNTDKFIQTVDKLRAAVPGIALTTDIIIGFPGESDKDFEDTIAMLSRVRFDMVYSFLYSPREGTKAAIMENQISADVKSSRMARLLKLQNEISYEKNLPYVDTVQRVLVDSPARKGAPNSYIGRTPTNKLVRFDSNDDQVGIFKNIKINRATPFDLFGEEI